MGPAKRKHHIEVEEQVGQCLVGLDRAGDMDGSGTDTGSLRTSGCLMGHLSLIC